MSGPQPGWKVMGCWGTLGLWPAISNLHPSSSIYILLFCSVESFNIHGKRPVRRCCQVLPHLDDLHELPPRPERSGEIRRAVADQWALSSILPCGMRTESGAMMQKILDLYGSIWIYWIFGQKKLESKLAEHLCVQIEVSLLRRHHRPRNGGEVFCSASTTLLVFFCIRSKDMRRQRR